MVSKRVMKLCKVPARTSSPIILTTSLLACVVIALLPSTVLGRQFSEPKRVLVLYWYDKDYPWNSGFDRSFQAALQSAKSGTVEYYSEYLETNRFPAEQQFLLLHDYLRRKYVDRHIDVVVATSDVSLDFLLKYRADLFPHTPIVFVATKHPAPEGLVKGSGMTGIISINAYKKTLDLALKLHPDTEQVFIISGTLERDKRIETLARAELQGYEGRVGINYLTDVPPDELIAKTKSLPRRSLVLYVWQQSQSQQGKVIESMEILALIAESAAVPIYRLSTPSYGGSRIVGGYINTAEASGTKVAEIVLQVANGTQPQEIPVESAPTVLEFDWRELQRWGISESQLPAGSLVRFKEVTFWGQYKGRIIAVLALVIFQTLLIAGLLFERSRRLRAIRGLTESEARYRNVVETQTELICRYLADTTLTFVNDAYCRYFGKSREELIGSKFIDFIPSHAHDSTMRDIQSLIARPRTETREHEVIRPDGSIGWQQWTNHVISYGDETFELQGLGRDVTERKRAESALREIEERNRAILQAIPDLMFLQSADGVYLDYHAKDPAALIIPAPQFIGKNMADVLPPPLATAFRAIFKRALETGETQVWEYDLEIQGQAQWFEARVAPCNGSKVLSVVRDITERKKADEALIVSEEFNRRIVESSTDCIKILDLDGNLIHMSPNGQRLLEITDIGPYLNSSWIDFWSGKEKVAAREACARARNGDVGTFQGFGPTPKGTPKWWHTVVTPIRGGRGNIEHLLAVSRDVTEQKQAREAVHESEERFAKAFKANPQPMSLTTLAEGKYLDVNESFLIMSGYTRDEVIGQTSTELGVFESPAYRNALLVEPLTSSGVVRNFEMKFRTKSGGFRVLLSSAELLELGGEKCILVASSDITDRKTLEEELRLSEREFSTLVENSPDVISRLDRDLRYIYISPSLERSTGIPTNRFIGKTPREIALEGYDWESFEASCREAFATQKAVSRAFDYAGRNYWTRIIPEFAPEGAVESVMAISEDVTNRIRAERELLQLTVRLFNLQDEERRRIARELHDGTAQNLFAISVDLAKLSQLDLAEKDEMQQLIAECQSLGDQSLQEIRTLSYVLHPPLLDHAGLVSALRWYVDGFSKRSGIYVDVVAQPIGRLPSEVEMALFRIVQEALTNVRRHSGSETASIRLERKSGEIILEISDRGRGLPPRAQPDGDGLMEMGVGIPGMRQRLRQLGGRLEIVSNHDGTVISAVVPLAKEASHGANTSRG